MKQCMSAGLVVVFLVAGCGGQQSDPEGERQDLALMGGKADVPSWIRHIPADFHCESTLSGRFGGWDSAHVYSFPGKVGYEYIFRFEATYHPYRGAVIAIYDAETGKRVAIRRSRPANAVKILYKAERSVKYLVAVYSITWWARGEYTLSAECNRLELTCTSAANCEDGQYCFMENCGQSREGIGTCKPRPDLCPEVSDPVCGCDGRLFDNSCKAAQHNMNVAHRGACLRLVIDPDHVTEGEVVTPTLVNTLAEPIFLAGCSPYALDQWFDGTWETEGPTHVCFWEGNATKIAPGESYVEDITRGLGGYRVGSHYSLHCADHVPLSDAACRITMPLASKFNVEKDKCMGAWLDKEGACRTPADGIYPDACCDDERVAFCHRVNDAYIAELANAKTCHPVAALAQCTEQAWNNLTCKFCLSYVNTTVELDRISAPWRRAACDTVIPVCAKGACAAPVSGGCQSVDGNGSEGVCETLY
ncbi:MAG: hypothetical protein JRH20_18505 [Deltaproteobacteria bacterium]|nr:hypothetical protein [Deltaproteobacteria bacterium]